MKISFILPFLLLIQFSLLPYTLATRPSKALKISDPTTASFEDLNDLPTAEASVSKEIQEFEVIPGKTKRIVIRLKGETEEVTFDIVANETDPTSFTTSVFINDKLDTVYNYQLLEPETLSLIFEYDTGLVLITGNYSYSLTTKIPEDQTYLWNITEEKIPGFEQDKAQDCIEIINSKPQNMFVLSATAGACGLFMLVAKVGLTVKRRRYVRADDLTGLCQNKLDLPKKLGDAVLFNPRFLRSRGCKRRDQKQGGEYVNTSLDNSSFGTNFETVKPHQNGSSLTSLASTAESLNSLATSRNYKITSISTIKLTDQESRLNGKTFQQPPPICFDNSKNRQKTDSYAPPLTLKRIHEEIKARTKCFEEDKGHEGLELTLDMDHYEGKCKGDKGTPTQKDIKALVRRMEEEGTIGYDCDPSAESNDEDQYEAPQLPNYFCCMLCFEGKRSNIVNPCRHVFACTDCMDDLMDKYKVCVLCSQQINGYEPL